MASSVDISDLPPEILAQVFDYLDGPAPSELTLHEQPHKGILRRNQDQEPNTVDHGSHLSFTADLKSSSCVSKRWRAMLLPRLFRNVIWRPHMTSLKLFNLRPISMLQFMLDNDLDHYVTTFTMMVDFTADDVDDSQLHHQIQSGDLEWLWDQLFSVIDPLRFTIIAPPATLAALMNRMLFLTDAWSFDVPYHILSLAKSTHDKKEHASKSPGFDEPGPSQSHPIIKSDVGAISSTTEETANRQHVDLKLAMDRASIALPKAGRRRYCPPPAPPASPLFTIRPWTSILLNEGSSIRAYQTYEFFLRQPPSMLSALLGTGEYPNNQALLPPSIVDFNYIAVFPLASHVHALLSNLPRLDRLFVQLTPRPSNEILQDQKAMKNIDMADLWMERNTAYSHLFAELTQVKPHSNWSSLKVFESGDAADKESWNMAVDFLRRSDITNWVVERDGVLVKTAEDGTATASTGSVIHHLLGEESLSVPLFQGSLERIAFNGTTSLPFSSRELYVHDGDDQSND
ncbi:hypothetical protein BKA67DRAFT_255487 [Truncatella angustata]|uniref:F-box domain-containing protein n=1 Tax=Truncatella angustata TaxID=152316 RepID=A0A9P8UPY9_9PEZI|nr:uncharacterized protein BKA67DRAFT_255487 [Truncatella angustata]KAH6656098.1 hypothetical protein BKA67DRAFT_255487 [Truncatella angustata]